MALLLASALASIARDTKNPGIPSSLPRPRSPIAVDPTPSRSLSTSLRC